MCCCEHVAGNVGTWQLENGAVPRPGQLAFAHSGAVQCAADCDLEPDQRRVCADIGDITTSCPGLRPSAGG